MIDILINTNNSKRVKYYIKSGESSKRRLLDSIHTEEGI